MTLKDLLSVLDNRIFVEVYNVNNIRIEEDYPNVILKECKENTLNVKVKRVSYDFYSTESEIDLQVFIEE